MPVALNIEVDRVGRIILGTGNLFFPLDSFTSPKIFWANKSTNAFGWIVSARAKGMIRVSSFVTRTVS